MKNKLTLLLTTILLAVLFSAFGLKGYASGPTDEIEEYNMTINVLEDGTVSIDYHIDWLVLDSDELGPVEWLQIGIPNSHYISMTAMSDNISSISYDSNSYGYYAVVYFYDKYYEGEHVVFDYNVVMDYLYEVNKFTEGETVYYFAPGWFDGVETKSMTIRWNAENAISWDPNCLNKEGYLTWETSLGSGDTYEVSVTYPNEAYMFDFSKTATNDDYYNEVYGGDYDYSYDYSYDDDNIFEKSPIMMVLGVIGTLIGGVFALIIGCWPILLIVFIVYRAGKGFKPATTTTTRKEIKRTLIKYYPTCPGCGAVRPEGKDKCDYCGRSFIESEEIIEEKDIPNPQQYSTEGVYRRDNNSAIRVHVVNVPIVTSRPSSSSSSHRSSCAHSSCAHSSCACAHSCACACACACAGGGRAGCSKKDFYNTGLKLKQLELKKKYRK